MSRTRCARLHGAAVRRRSADARPQQRFHELKKAYPGRRLLVLSNTAGAAGWDHGLEQAAEVERATGVAVLLHSVKKPGCGAAVMAYFRRHPETGVTDAAHVAVVGDRLMTDAMLANMMGAWAFWIRDGVVPPSQKSVVSGPAAPPHTPGCADDPCPDVTQFSRMERRLADLLVSCRVRTPVPQAPRGNEPSRRGSGQ